MKYRFLFYIIIISTFNFSLAQKRTLSPQAEISVLTIGQGENLNDAFGHSAFRIKDRANNLDVTYGYGRYDFDTPNFYLKFAQGKLNYLIGKRKFGDFFETYRFYDRTIREQKLNLDVNQKQKLYNFLVNNYKPENRRYLYDFFYDNCATRIRDVAQDATSGQIKYVEDSETSDTFRNLIHDKIGRNTWGSFGIDIALGSVIDTKVDAYQSMFLPENIFLQFSEATIDNSKPLVKSTNTIYKAKHNNGYKTNFFISPIFVMSLISALIIFITYRDHKTSKRSQWLDVSIFLITGIIGVLLLMLWFGTDHTATGYNYNLLWAFPIHLFAVWQFFKTEIKNWFRGYLKFSLILLCLMTMHWIIGVQSFALGLLPLLIALFIRYIYLNKFYKKE